MTANQVSNNELTAQDEGFYQAYSEEEYQAYLAEQEDAYEESVRAHYRARGLANIY